MAIVVLVLWLFTAGVGVYLLVTSNLGRARPAATAQAAEPPAASVTAAVQAAPAAQAAPARAAPAAKPRPPKPRPPKPRPPPKPSHLPPQSGRCAGRRGIGSIRRR